MGGSAGGGLAAGVTLLARDRGGPAIARQLLIYPMLDDRTRTADPEMAHALLWSVDDNVTGWDALLGAASEGDDVSIYAAPARATDLSDLPPAYIDVGGLDLFRDEDVAYATRLARSWRADRAARPARRSPRLRHPRSRIRRRAQRVLDGRLRFLREPLIRVRLRCAQRHNRSGHAVDERTYDGVPHPQ